MSIIKEWKIIIVVVLVFGSVGSLVRYYHDKNNNPVVHDGWIEIIEENEKPINAITRINFSGNSQEMEKQLIEFEKTHSDIKEKDIRVRIYVDVTIPKGMLK